MLSKRIKVQNAIITLGNTDDSGKGRHFKSRFIKPGLAGYPGQFGNALIQKENLDRFVHTLRNKPVTINHKDKITEKDKKGEVFNVWFNPDDGWYWCDGIIFDDEAINLINNGWSVSCAYDFTKADNSGGTENNIPYDIEFLDGEFNHLALVDNPRYEGANIVFNSKAVIENWNEQDHPRDEQGKFTSGSSATKYKSRFSDLQNLIGTLEKDDKFFDSKYRTAEKRLQEKLDFAKKELKEKNFENMPSVKKVKENIVKAIEEEIEQLKSLKNSNTQNSLTDTILNAIAELITGE